MATKTFHISIPDYMQSFVQEKIKEQFHKSPGSYVHELIRQDHLRSEKVKLTNMLLVGLASERVKMTNARWKNLESRVANRIKKSK